MAKRGRGAIVNLSTMIADYGAPGMSLYGSSKAAINLLTITWAVEYGRSGVRINAVSPPDPLALKAQTSRQEAAFNYANTPAHKSRPTPIEFLTSSSFRV
jgi:NAD(P)-dependent dehydrogenase (short-subunit alcohol dehydrogenase family)